MPSVFVCKTHEETFALGESFASLLKPGSIVALKGTLGAGKTCFAKGVALRLGVNEEVTSPTYTIMSEYDAFFQGAPIVLYHIDAYRLNGSDDFSAIGGEEILYSQNISLIEWSERIENMIPPDSFVVDIRIDSFGARIIDISQKTKQNDVQKASDL